MIRRSGRGARLASRLSAVESTGSFRGGSEALLAHGKPLLHGFPLAVAEVQFRDRKPDPNEWFDQC